MALKRLSALDKRSIEELYVAGNSGMSIANLISHPRSTVNGYIVKIFGKRIQRNKMKLNLSSEEKLGEFIGAFAGDGNLYYSHKKHYQVSIFTDLKEIVYANYLSKLMRELLGRVPHVRPHKGTRGNTTLVVQIHGEEAVNLIKRFLTFKSGDGEKKTYSVRLLNSVESYSKKFLRGFIKGLVASDGSVYFKYYPNRNRFFKNIEVNLTSKELALQYKNALDMFGINSRFYTYIPKNLIAKPVYEVHIKALSSIQKFYYKIGLSEERKSAKLKNIMLASIPSTSFSFLDRI